MNKYLRIYGNIALVVVIAAVAVLFAPALITMAASWLPLGARITISTHSGLIALLVRLVIFVIGGSVTWLLVRDRRYALDEAVILESGDEGEIEVYRGFTQDVGVEPTVARRVIEATTTMSDEERSLDFHRANLPNFAAELGYRLGIDSKTREMMKEFFETNRDNNTRRSFSTSMRLTMEGDHIEQTHDTNAEVEPISRYAPRDPANDPNWRGEVTQQELHAKIFGGWDEPLGEGGDSVADGDNDQSKGGAARSEKEFDPSVESDRVKSDAQTVVSPEIQDLHSQSEDELTDEMDEEEAVTEFSEDEFEDIDTDDLVVESEIDNDDYEDNGYEQKVEASTEILKQILSDDDFVLEDEVDDDDGLRTLVDAELFDQVEHDPVIAGLINAISLTRRLPNMSNLRYLFGLYGSDIPSLIAEFSAPSITHVDQMGSTIEPLFNHAGVRRHETPAWVVDLGDREVREDDLNAVVWIPTGIARLGDLNDRQAWKLVPVTGGSAVTFYTLQPEMPLIGARLEWILANLYDDLELLEDNEQLRTFHIPSLGVTIDLMVTDDLNHGDKDIHGDLDKVPGPEMTELCDISIFSDGGRKWFSSRLGVDEIEHPDWLAVFTLFITLCMRTEPVTSKDLLGQWATPESKRGKQLIEMLTKIFGDRLKGDSDGWVLSNVRLDLFWLEDYLKDDLPNEAWTDSVRDFLVRKFEVGSLDWILNLGSMDPKTRTSDLIQMEKLLRYVLSEVVDLLGPDAEGELAEKLDSVAKTIGKEV